VIEQFLVLKVLERMLESLRGLGLWTEMLTFLALVLEKVHESPKGFVGQRTLEH
jgi:hypothetical protein